ncbi:hypothetical protein [uncultured Roseobacter sp.]|uniref:hypothetical protein n=1 Tax=uncultured Roseobacter sp. TaxID=114847 RepID=UPI00260882AA|nr:hypothetical protein [uncultured Roseobacter sp.]
MRTKTGPNGSADKHVKEIKRKTRREKNHICERSINEFERGYLTPGQIVFDTGHVSIHVARWLDHNGIESIDCQSGYVRVYARDIAAVVIQSLQSYRDGKGIKWEYISRTQFTPVKSSNMTSSFPWL